MKFNISIFILCFNTLIYCSILCADTRSDLAKMSIEELINLKVTIASKKEKKISESPSAIYVITQEDIRRSGYTSVPEILRLVPGFHVSQINSNAWAISSRGFSNKYSNKLLVLMDGRSLYNPVFSGVDWNIRDTFIEDIDRIEVIRGPGGALWGTNAVNGVVNIISKKANDTTGKFLTIGVGDEDKNFSGFRYGKEFMQDLYIKSYVKYFKRAGFLDTYSNKGHDEWSSIRSGFKLEKSNDDYESFTIQGDIFNGQAGDNEYEFYDLKNYFSSKNLDFSGGNILLRFKHKFSNLSDIRFQTYYDDVRQSIKNEYNSQIKTIDVDFQHNFNYFDNQEIIWGIGFRYIDDKIDYYTQSDISLRSKNNSSKLFSGFFQNELSLINNKLKITIGSKFEKNEFTGWEFQPVGTIIWNQSLQNCFWASFARAVRTPSMYDLTINEIKKEVQPEDSDNGINQNKTIELTYHVYQNIDSEYLYSYESGFRMQALDNLYFDIAGFYNVYKNLEDIDIKEYSNNYNSYRKNYYMNISNKDNAIIYGFEIVVNFDIYEWWHLRGSYSLLIMDLANNSENIHLNEIDNARKFLELPYNFESPKNQFNIRSFFELPYNIEFDTFIRYVENIPKSDVDSYVEADCRLSYKPNKNLELIFVGKNLFDKGHSEYFDTGYESAEVERNFYCKLNYNF